MIKCFQCPNMATWYYMPWSKDNETDIHYPANKYFCDDCISRGCSCNDVYSNDDKESWESDAGTFTYDSEINRFKDQLGRELPCIEYEYSKTGFDEKHK